MVFGIICYLINGIWYILLPYKWYCMVLYCIVLRSWLRRAGCVSQDAYILHMYLSYIAKEVKILEKAFIAKTNWLYSQTQL